MRWYVSIKVVLLPTIYHYFGCKLRKHAKVELHISVQRLDSYFVVPNMQIIQTFRKFLSLIIEPQVGQQWREIAKTLRDVIFEDNEVDEGQIDVFDLKVCIIIVVSNGISSANSCCSSSS